MNKMIKLICLLILIGIFPTHGQVVSDEEIIELVNGHVLQLDYLSSNNISFIRQVGEENNAIAIQEKDGLTSNVSMINQDGIGNTGYIEQTGSELKTYLWQYNITNEANLWSAGANIETSVKQDGERNVINSYIQNDGVNKRSAKFLQEGNQNKIDFSLLGSHPMEQVAIINQYGNQHEVEAHMEPTSAPIIINQHGGEGMKVNVSTSTFNFPMKR